jgi:hypothetical protein
MLSESIWGRCMHSVLFLALARAVMRRYSGWLPYSSLGLWALWVVFILKGMRSRGAQSDNGCPISGGPSGSDDDYLMFHPHKVEKYPPE